MNNRDRILAFLGKEGESTVAVICKRLKMKEAGVISTLDELRTGNMVTVRRGANDRFLFGVINRNDMPECLPLRNIKPIPPVLTPVQK